MSATELASLLQANNIAGSGIVQIELVACKAGGNYAQMLANLLKMPVSANIYRVNVASKGIYGIPQAVTDAGEVLDPGVGWEFYMPE